MTTGYSDGLISCFVAGQDQGGLLELFSDIGPNSEVLGGPSTARSHVTGRREPGSV